MLGAAQVHGILRQFQPEVVPGIVGSGNHLSPGQLPDLGEAAQQARHPLWIADGNRSSQVIGEGVVIVIGGIGRGGLDVSLRRIAHGVGTAEQSLAREAHAHKVVFVFHDHGRELEVIGALRVHHARVVGAVFA